MKILKSWLQEHIVETLPDDETIISAFILKSSEVEGVETIKDENGNSDTVFDLKVLPDRAHYMLSHRGVAYDLSVILGLELKKTEDLTKNFDFNRDLDVQNKKDTDFVQVNSNLCRRYNATLIENINNLESPQWLKYRLQAIGSRSINAIVDATNYAMFDSGQPLHAFDADKVSGGIVVRFANDGETMTTLDEKEIKLKKSHLIIADQKGPLALAGIKGGRRAEVDMNTKRIILESASFDPVCVRRTSFEVGIRNDSSKRFENEITSHMVSRGITAFFHILGMVCPDYKITKNSDVFDSLPKKWSVDLQHSKIESILNYPVKESRVKEILERFSCEVYFSNGIYQVTPPYERLDLVIPEDLIDEIGRVEGLDKVKSIIPSIKTNHEFDRDFILVEKIKDILCSNGFTEIQTRSFTGKGEIEVLHPVAIDKAFLRTNLADNMLESMALAIRNAPILGLEEIRMFEIGKVFRTEGEGLDLCFAIDFAKKVKNKPQITKIEIENIVSNIEKSLGVKLEGRISTDSNLYYVRNIESLVDSLPTQTINPDSLEIKRGNRNTFTPFSQFPFIVRDIAVFVPESITAENVWATIELGISSSGAGELLARHSLFDTFKKENKVSYAFRMIFQSINRTLTDDEVNKIMEIVYKELKNKGWEVR